VLTPTAASSPARGGRRHSPSLLPSGIFFPFFLITALFFLWGILNSLNDVLIWQFMKSFEIARFQAGLIQSAFYMGHLPAALFMRKRGSQSGSHDRPSPIAAGVLPAAGPATPEGSPFYPALCPVSPHNSTDGWKFCRVTGTEICSFGCARDV
jgi:hypothetical protein